MRVVRTIGAAPRVGRRTTGQPPHHGSAAAPSVSPTALGLAITWAFVEAMGGTFTAAKRDDRAGARVTVALRSRPVTRFRRLPESAWPDAGFG
ncbi:hypothetical protein Q8W71_04750 [Methylobacterium sp. NEAU 140]|uniref:hypothetical protein n=1 Tax=Methylobacterium sp. NEAU 140 TaxID=3064945 RepID=UPI0027337513|nr:hypothetical protein [Methylobacterium sp. NEAU 140]MDP4021926.1 hypothetical protein [Methylobacterium sp. NEAU 140]